jgi:hypothetical protein
LIDSAFDSIREATDMDDLKHRWDALPKELQGTLSVIAAKDAAKERITAPQPDLDDKIPY